MGTVDHLIILMGIHLAHIHGKDNVVVVTADDRLSNILNKCNEGISKATIKKLKMNECKTLTGKKFCPDTFPQCINLKTATKNELSSTFGS